MDDPKTWLGWIIVALVLYALSAALWNTLWLRNLPHKRYKKLHVYAERKNGDLVYVPRDILEIYKHIKDPSIKELDEDPPDGVKYLISWGVILVLPRVLSKIFMPFESDSGSKKD